MDKNYDIIVIGNGILGLTLSYFLKKSDKNIKIALIGDPNRKGSATLGAGAMTNVWSELTSGQFENEALADRFLMTRKGGELWDSFAEELNEYLEEKLYVKKGTYLLKTAKSTKIENSSFKYIEKSVQDRDIPHKKIDVDSLDWVKPSQGCGPQEIMWLPDGRIDSRKVINGLDQILKKLNISIYDSKAKKVSTNAKMFSKEDFKVLLENGETISGKKVVLANGSYAQALIDEIPAIKDKIPRLLFGIGAGIDITFPKWVHEYGGLGKEIFDLDAVIRTTDRGGACGVHLIPYDEKGKFYLGASSGVSLDDDIEPKLHGVHVLLHSLITEISRAFFFAGIQLRSNGFRPTTVDAFPLIGETNVAGLWILNGTKRDGFTMSPFIARELAKEILGKSSELPKRFTPCRKLISYKDKETAIKETELMYMGSEFQHGGIQAPFMVEKYLDFKRKEIQSIYEKRNINNFGIHPEVLHLYENDKFFKLINHSRETVKTKAYAL